MSTPSVFLQYLLTYLFTELRGQRAHSFLSRVRTIRLTAGICKGSLPTVLEIGEVTGQESIDIGPRWQSLLVACQFKDLVVKTAEAARHRGQLSSDLTRLPGELAPDLCHGCVNRPLQLGDSAFPGAAFVCAQRLRSDSKDELALGAFLDRLTFHNDDIVCQDLDLFAQG